MPFYQAELPVSPENPQSGAAMPIFLSYNSKDEYISRLESSLKDI